MKTDCGHDVVHEDSVLRCAMCESEEQKAHDDATWNAAIEAAAARLESLHRVSRSAPLSPSDVTQALADVRSIKRGQS